MPTFIVNRNAQANGDHEVHNTTTGCSYMPELGNQVPLGYHADCRGAVAEAKRLGWSRANGCYWCANACHTS